jgi:hypothetical protein
MAPTIPDFVARWQGSISSERSADQPYFVGLCHVPGQPIAAAGNLIGSFYTFVKRVQKPGGGFASHPAYRQLQNYWEGPDNPPLHAVTMGLVRVDDVGRK